MKSQRTGNRCLMVGRLGQALPVVAVLAMPAFCGCQPATTETPPAQADHPDSTAPPTKKSSTAQSREIWEVFFIGKTRIGYQQTTVRSEIRNQWPVVRVEGFSRMVLERDGQPTTMETRFSDIETPEGSVIEFDSQDPLMRVSGRVAADGLEMTTITAGKAAEKATKTRVPWTEDCGGFFAVQQSLLDQPMKPGERRSITSIVPGMGNTGVTELAARQVEEVPLLSGAAKLLRIDTTLKLGGQSMTGAIWTDAAGDVQKTRVDMMNIEVFRATKAEALAESKGGQLDVIRSIQVPVSRRLARPHSTRRVRYRIELDGGDPASIFPAGPSQQVTSVGPNTAEVTVYAIRPGDPFGNPEAKDDPATDRDREANNLIQSGDRSIRLATSRAAGQLTDPWEAAVALEKYVHGAIKIKDYGQAFDSAADVLKSGRGDCTEHAVLLAALARARGLPARAAMGLVYQDGSFLYHMWTEVHIAGRWIPIDGTLAQGGIGAAHLKLAHSSLEGASVYTAILPIAQVAGKLKIEILEVDPAE